MITRNNNLKHRLRKRSNLVVLVQKQIDNNDTRIMDKKNLNNLSNQSTLSSSPTSIKSIKTSPIIIKSNKESPTNNNGKNNNGSIQNKPRPLGVRNSQRIKTKILDASKAIEPQPLRINRVRTQALDLLAKRDSIRRITEDSLFNERNKLLFMLGIGLIPRENVKKSPIISNKNNHHKDSGILQQQKGLIQTPSVVLERLPETVDKSTIQRLILEQKNKKKKTKHLKAVWKFAEALACNNRAKLCAVRRKRNVSSSNSDIINDENSILPTFTLYTCPPKKLAKDGNIICIDLANEPTEDAFFVEVRKRLSLCNTVLNVIC